MTDLEILHQMINHSAKVSPEKQAGKQKVDLVEPSYPTSKATIFGLPDDVIIIKSDAFRCEQIFQGSRGECKRADYIIVARTKSKKVALFIEMKAAKGSRKEIIQQLTGARCFFSYCQEIGKTFWDEKGFLEGFNHRFISLGNTSISKRKTRIERHKSSHDSPDRMMKIDCPHKLQFNMLAG
ncbi:MAG: hypothetical protein HQM10_15545 [Candidatus Riflebacteria bacterium]|nr:hypothetical protein [Candidatus Riflebacteria bacterium]